MPEAHFCISYTTIEYGYKCLSSSQVDILRAGVAVFVTHGGQNSFMEALAQATPLVMCPTAGDQFDNARQVNNRTLIFR